MRMRPVHSSAIALQGYDEATRTLRIRYRNGRTYDYLKVPRKAYQEFLAADSAGEFVNLEIKPVYRYAKVE